MQTITIVERTCFGCPTLFDVLLPDGSAGYIKYRWGLIQLKPETEKAGLFQEANVEEQIGDQYDGIISLPDVVTWLKKQGYEVVLGDKIKILDLI